MLTLWISSLVATRLKIKAAPPKTIAVAMANDFPTTGNRKSG